MVRLCFRLAGTNNNLYAKYSRKTRCLCKATGSLPPNGYYIELNRKPRWQRVRWELRKGTCYKHILNSPFFSYNRLCYRNQRRS